MVEATVSAMCAAVPVLVLFPVPQFRNAASSLVDLFMEIRRSGGHDGTAV